VSRPSPLARLADAVDRRGLRFKLLLAAGLAMLAVVLATAGVASWLAAAQQAQAQQSRSQAIAEALAIQLERILALEIPLDELQGFDEQCDEVLARHRDLAYALVVDEAGRPVFRSQRRSTPAPLLPASPPQAWAADDAPLRTPDARVQLAAVPVHDPAGSVRAWALVGHPRALLQAERDALLGAALAAGGLMLLVALGAVYAVVTRVMLGRLGRVVAYVEALDRRERPAVALPLQGRDELAVLARGLDHLVQTVSARESELRTARDAAEEANHAKSRFLAVMSHELRTPLNAVLGMAELLDRAPLAAPQKRQVQQMLGASRALSGLIGDVLDLGRIEAGRLVLDPQPFELRPLLAESLALFELEAQRRHLGLSLSVDPALPARVRGDAQRIRQVLLNLVGNALKFTEQGGVSVTAAPADAARPDWLRFSVTDTGPGIAPALQPRVFDAFQQGDDSSTRRHGGAGLGLAIARQLCQALGGDIQLRSTPGQGSTFWFELPLPAVDAPASAPAPASPPGIALPAGAAEPPAGAPARPPLRVLLVEDNAANRDYVAQCLAGAHLALTLGEDGLDGIARLRERTYDVVLLDWQLPGIDGPAVLALLRALEAQTGRPRAHVIAVTAHAAAGDRDACLAAGADDYLAKPFGCDALLARLAALRPELAPCTVPR